MRPALHRALEQGTEEEEEEAEDTSGSGRLWVWIQNLEKI